MSDSYLSKAANKQRKKGVALQECKRLVSTLSVGSDEFTFDDVGMKVTWIPFGIRMDACNCLHFARFLNGSRFLRFRRALDLEHDGSLDLPSMVDDEPFEANSMSWRTTAFSIALRSHAALCVQLKTDFKSFGEAIRAAQHYTTDAQLSSLRWIADRANMAKHRDLAALGSRAALTPANSGTCASGWPSGVPGKQALQGEIVVPEFGREIPCAPPSLSAPSSSFLASSLSLQHGLTSSLHGMT